MYKKEKRIPTFIVLVILFLGIGSAVYLDRSLHIFTSSAKNNIVPQDVRFANISDNSFTVSWLTSTPATGTAVVTGNSQSITYIDDLDSDDVPRPRLTHYITVKNLKENTAYTVKIYNSNYSQKTAPKLATVISIPPAHGTIVTNNNQAASSALIYLSIGNSALLSARADSSGLWAIPLTNLRSQNLSERPEIADNDIIQINAFTGPSQTASAVVDVRSIRQNLDLPVMQIGNTYNFITSSNKKDIAQIQNQKILGTQVTNTNYKVYDILFPLQDGDTTTDNRPRIRGVGIKGTQILITVNSLPQSARVSVDQDGTWVWRPPLSLEPGTHRISIQGFDQSGNLLTVMREFIVLKSGEGLVLGAEATPSATLTPSPTSTPAASPTLIIPTISQTTTPTGISTPTSAFPSATVKVTPPASGSTQSTLILIGGAVFLVISGIKLFLSL
ncbi:fibronectin type III domain-containing protein [Candidatus Gottesmanbacteria bacterium]|nr:fibronectin type III domain-containing protein [Candidatus Gottesmanbacteria bacterium]